MFAGLVQTEQRSRLFKKFKKLNTPIVKRVADVIRKEQTATTGPDQGVDQAESDEPARKQARQDAMTSFFGTFF